MMASTVYETEIIVAQIATGIQHFRKDSLKLSSTHALSDFIAWFRAEKD